VGKDLYFECVGGASGDMCLGALVDLGLPVELLQGTMDGLLGPGTVVFAHNHREEHGIRATQLEVKVLEESTHHRHLGKILGMIGDSTLPDEVKAASSAVFRRLAEAEGLVHGVPPEEVHFHEVGAVDAIADITGTCLGIHHLGVNRIFAGPLKTGRGTILAAHGVIPLPAPATLALARGRTLEYLDLEGELTTPTGAALLCTLSEERLALSIRPERTGYGCGQRTFPGLPNLLRATLGVAADQGCRRHHHHCGDSHEPHRGCHGNLHDHHHGHDHDHDNGGE
jgi:uncharacterized protein (TIGR00299 family) protein